MPRDTQCQLVMFECGIASNSIAFAIRANAVRLIILLLLRSVMPFRTWMDMRRSFALSRIICFGSNGMFKLLLFDAMIYCGAHNRCSRITYRFVANILVALKPAARILISFSVLCFHQWNIFHESRFMNERNLASNFLIYSKLEMRMKVNIHWLGIDTDRNGFTCIAVVFLWNINTMVSINFDVYC